MDARNYSLEDTVLTNSSDGNITTTNVFRNPFQVPFSRVIFITCYGLVFAMCITGNSMVLVAIARSPRLRSMTNFFLANLAVADFCFGLFCILPNLSTFLSPNWILGRAMCKIYYYVRNVSYTASIVILTVIAVERYIAIIYPLKAKHFRRKRKLLLSLLIIWSVALGYNIPYLVYYDIISIPYLDIEYCYVMENNVTGFKGLSLANLIVWYIFPLSVIGILYIRICIKMWNVPITGHVCLRESSSYRTSHSSSRTSMFDYSRPGSQKAGFKMQFMQCDETSSSREKTAKLEACHQNSKEMVKQDSISVEPNRNKGEHKTLALKVRNASISARSSYKTSNLNRERRKVIRLLITVVVAFAFCTLPHHLKVVNHFWNVVRMPSNVAVYFSPISSIILFLNSCLNPILYALFSTNFRQAFKESLICF